MGELAMTVWAAFVSSYAYVLQLAGLVRGTSCTVTRLLSVVVPGTGAARAAFCCLVYCATMMWLTEMPSHRNLSMTATV